MEEFLPKDADADPSPARKVQKPAGSQTSSPDGNASVPSSGEPPASSPDSGGERKYLGKPSKVSRDAGKTVSPSVATVPPSSILFMSGSGDDAGVMVGSTISRRKSNDSGSAADASSPEEGPDAQRVLASASGLVRAAPPETRRNRRGPRSVTSKYRGVTCYKRTGRWEAHIWDEGKQVHLGSFKEDFEAAKVRYSPPRERERILPPSLGACRFDFPLPFFAYDEAENKRESTVHFGRGVCTDASALLSPPPLTLSVCFSLPRTWTRAG